MNSLSTIAVEPILYSDQQLHGVFFSPVGDIRAAVLLIPPLFEEKRSAHRALTVCAHALAQSGAAVLHPDLYGTGNSRGTLSEISLDQWLADIHAAADFLQQRTNAPLTVLACRAGALLAAQAITGGLHPEQFILWHPVISGRSYLQQLRTRRMIQDKITGEAPPEVGPYEVEGHTLSPSLHAEIEALRLPVAVPSPRLGLLQCSFNEKLLTEYERLVTQWGAEHVRVRCITCEPFWHPHSPTDYSDLARALAMEVLL